MPQAFIHTYGCQMNVQDTLQMKGLLSQVGYTNALTQEDADLVLFVTCSIRQKAEHKLYSDLGRLRPLVEENPRMMVGVAGCVAQQEKEKLIRRFPFLDLVFGPDAIRTLPEMVQTLEKRKKEGLYEPLVSTRFQTKKDFEFVNLIHQGEENRIHAFVTIQKGCDNVCSFCIVPRVRGGEVSRPSSEIIEEIQRLVDMGVQEVTLLGQNVNSYGLKDSEELSFAELLTAIANRTSLKRLRFTTSHPKDVGDDLVEAFRDLEILRPHFHLPVQSGSDRILKAMRRYYTQEHYLQIVEKIKKVRPGISFTTDIIVGFPGETESDFNDTLRLLDAVRFDNSFSFVYSARPGTQAVNLEDDVPRSEKEARLALLMDRQREIARAINAPLLDQTLSVLIERPAEEGERWMGRTGTNKIVHVSFPKDYSSLRDLTGQEVDVRITLANPHSLVGEVSDGKH